MQSILIIRLSGHGFVVADHLLSALLFVENASGSFIYEFALS